MRRTMVGAAVGLVLLAGCGGSPEPAQPPTQEEALTTATVAPPKPVDEVAATTDVATATTDPTGDTVGPPTGDAVGPPTGDTVGPPTLPEEAEEQSEAGAEAFALHYLDMVNYTGQYPEPGLLERLSTESCKTCDNYEANVASLIERRAANDGDAASVGEAQAVAQGDSFIVFVNLEQNAYKSVTEDGEVVNEYDRIRGVEFKFTLVPGDPYLVDEIQVSTS